MQIIYSLRVGKPDAMAMVSVATSWWSLGMSIGKVVLLKDLLPYKNKQAKKVKELQALMHGTDCWLTVDRVLTDSSKTDDSPTYSIHSDLCHICILYQIHVFR